MIKLWHWERRIREIEEVQKRQKAPKLSWAMGVQDQGKWKQTEHWLDQNDETTSIKLDCKESWALQNFGQPGELASSCPAQLNGSITIKWVWLGCNYPPNQQMPSPTWVLGLPVELPPLSWTSYNRLAGKLTQWCHMAVKFISTNFFQPAWIWTRQTNYLKENSRHCKCKFCEG